MLSRVQSPQLGWTLRIRVGLATILAIHSLVRIAAGTNLPSGGCDACRQLRGLEDAGVSARNLHKHALVGNFKGLFISQRGKFKPHAKGSGSVNLEVFQEVGNHVAVVNGEAGDTLEKCCDACSRTAGCYQFHFFRSNRLRDNVNVRGFMSGVQCYLLGKDGGAGHSGEYRTPLSGDVKEQRSMSPYFPLSWLGGMCGGRAQASTSENAADNSTVAAPLATSSPSLIPGRRQEGSAKKLPRVAGLSGIKRRAERPPPLTPQGLLNASFCLVSDRRLHINIVLRESPPQAAAGESADDSGDVAFAGAPSTNPTLARISTAAIADAAAAARKEAERRATAAVAGAASAIAGGEVSWEEDGGEGKRERAQAAIREVGFVWVADGLHSLHMAVTPTVTAESGPAESSGGSSNAGTADSQRTAESLLSLLELDGVALSSPKEVGDRVTGAGGLVLSKVAEEREWPVNMVKFRVEIAGLVEVEVRASIVQGEGDAGEGHLTVKVNRVKSSPTVNGLLAQAIRASSKLALPIIPSYTSVAVGDPQSEAKTTLSGPLWDYVSTTAVSANCRFSTFGVVA
ncbi:hypothetical protein CLOM_g11405 [Closterium sp. NIES-68]|nr:hypothetical protein CLOM_g11405 [Closterium sp. NIES-68]GJP71707.1 hypothetical protein CLOP_g2511 [Closterium sp. NIES-67]